MQEACFWTAPAKWIRLPPNERCRLEAPVLRLKPETPKLKIPKQEPCHFGAPGCAPFPLMPLLHEPGQEFASPLHRSREVCLILPQTPATRSSAAHCTPSKGSTQFHHTSRRTAPVIWDFLDGQATLGHAASAKPLPRLDAASKKEAFASASAALTKFTRCVWKQRGESQEKCRQRS